jgi:hypothetical protein
MCVEVSGLDTEEILVRNSEAPVLILGFTRGEWLTFIEGVRRGDFDLRPVSTEGQT